MHSIQWVLIPSGTGVRSLIYCSFSSKKPDLDVQVPSMYFAKSENDVILVIPAVINRGKILSRRSIPANLEHVARPANGSVKLEI